MLGRAAFALMVLAPLMASARPQRVAQGRSFVEARPEPGLPLSVRIVNQTFEPVWMSQGAVSRMVLLDQTIETVEGFDGHSVERVVMRALDPSGKTPRQLFEIREKGSSARVLHAELYVVSPAVCCSANPGHAVYSLRSGKRLFFTGGRDPLVLQLHAMEKDSGAATGPSTGYVGVHARGTSQDELVYGRGPSGVLVTYAGRTEPRDAVLIVLEAAVETWGVTAQWVPRPGPAREPRSLMADEADLAATPPVVEVTLPKVGTVRIPIRKQRFAEAEAVAPRGVRLQRVPPP